jgi:hypothetical protein
MNVSDLMTREVISVGLVDGVVRVESAIGWESDDTHLSPAPVTDHEPGAASITARQRPWSIHS